MDGNGGHRRSGPRSRSQRRALRTFWLARRGRLCRQAALRPSLRIRRPRGEACPADRRRPMTVPHSDALVFFGATGDLAYKKIFPALQAMIRRGHLNVPIIGVASSGWNLDQFKARAKDSPEKHGHLEAAA